MTVVTDPIETARLFLRPYTDGDLDDFLNIRGRPDVVRYLYTDVLTREEREKALAYMDRIHAAAITATPYEEFVESVMEPARGTPGFEHFGEVDAGLWGFLVRNLRYPYEPVAALERIRRPVLAIFGENDLLVPVDASVRIFETALARAGNEDVTIRVFPGADQRIRTGDPNGFAEGYLETMAAWLRERMV